MCGQRQSGAGVNAQRGRQTQRHDSDSAQPMHGSISSANGTENADVPGTKARHSCRTDKPSNRAESAAPTADRPGPEALRAQHILGNPDLFFATRVGRVP